jgi:hypothetical protein
MKGTILLNHTENTHQVEEEEKNRFLRDILEQSGVPIDTFWGNGETVLSVNQKMRLRGVLTVYSVHVIDDHDGVMEIYVDDELIGRWNKCIYKLRRDPAQRDPKKQLYLEMEIDCWSVFDTQENT